MKQIVHALNYLHTNNICHRDIKLDNFMLFKYGDITHIKMIDFGISVPLLSKDQIMHEMLGTPYFIAPEILDSNYT